MHSSKKSTADAKSTLVFTVDPTECPFREFRDNELSPDFWGMGPAAFRVACQMAKGGSKPPIDLLWKDDQTQPLPRSVRHYLHGWVRAEELAMNRWESEVIIFEENDGGKMSVADIQLSHAQVLLRSSFSRRVMSSCFMLERVVEGFQVEHQWDNFTSTFGTEGWRAKYHIYSPGMKPGGGLQHKPGLSRNGCYLVRLYYLGAWRCVWVNDQVPVDATDSPLLPFSPLLCRPPAAKTKQPALVTSPYVHLWPLLICKALLKLAAPDMNCDEEVDVVEDEIMPEFSILHALTGSMRLTLKMSDSELLWELLTEEVPVFSWDDDDETMTSTVKSKSAKKPTNKDNEKEKVKRGCMATLLIEDSKNLPSYTLPGITPGLEMSLIVTMARDIPLKRPLPEPEVPLWKHYRWVDWARHHGLYEAYDCPRTRYLKVNGLMKLSYAPHLLDIQSTESITFNFRDAQQVKKPAKETAKPTTANGNALASQNKEEFRDWIQYEAIQQLIVTVSLLYFPSMYQFTTAGNSPSVKQMKVPNRALDIAAPKSAPLYLQIDGPEQINLRISLNVLHPRILMNSGVPVVDYIEPAYLILEKIELFKDSEVSMPKAYVQTRGYDSVQVQFLPGRHFCRIWVHSRMNWTISLLSPSTLLLGSRDVIFSAAAHECSWVVRFSTVLSTAFNNWIRQNKSSSNFLGLADREFYSSYQPDLEWDKEVVGYDKSLLHWMFRKALQSHLSKRMSAPEFQAVCPILRRYFCDPDFGFPEKPLQSKSLRQIVDLDPCDCGMPEVEEVECMEEQFDIEEFLEEKPLVDPYIMDELLKPPTAPVASQVCELATEELPCGILKQEREKVVKKHEAATVIQAHLRGLWARRCLKQHVIVTPEVLKSLMDYAFGNHESLSALMNEFFSMYPGAKYAYSVASALSGVYGLQQHGGTSQFTSRCKWIPYFQGVFYCHAPVKVHFDVQSSIPSTFAVYDNDTGKKMPQVYNAHVTFDFTTNVNGYTVMGHGTLNEPTGVNSEVHWQLTVLSSINEVFHVCDNDMESCKVNPLPSVNKLHLDEIFIPNRRNILGGIEIVVSKHESMSFRVAATSPDLIMIAEIKTQTIDGDVEVIDECSGVGEIYWPFIKLEPAPPSLMLAKKRSISHANLAATGQSARFLKGTKPKPHSAGNKSRSATKIKDTKIAPEAKRYFIEVVAPNGWPLTLEQWKRVMEVRETQVMKTKPEPPKKGGKEKFPTKDQSPIVVVPPNPDDAYVQLECSYIIGGACPKRDDQRDLEFLAARKSWDANEPGRNLRGAYLRNEFRTEFLETLPPPPSESARSFNEEWLVEEMYGEALKMKEPAASPVTHQGPTPVSESGEMEMSVESEIEARYLSMPDLLKDKFVPLHFVPLCTKEKSEEESAYITPDKALAAQSERHARIEAAIQRMNELQTFNEIYMLQRQRNRFKLVEKLSIDAQWNPELVEVLEERDNAITRETLARTLSATKKKQQEAGKKQQEVAKKQQEATKKQGALKKK